MTRTIIISIAAVLAVALAATPVLAKKGDKKTEGKGYRDGSGDVERGEGQRGKGFKRHGRKHKGDHMRWTKQLDLTPDQEKRVKKLREDTKAVNKPLQEKARTLRQKMRAKWQAGSPDEKAILNLYRDIHKIEGQIGEHHIQTKIDIFSILTPEQRNKMKSMREERRQDRKNRKGRMGRGNKGPGEKAFGKKSIGKKRYEKKAFTEKRFGKKAYRKSA